jgi:hypothetical protein
VHYAKGDLIQVMEFGEGEEEKMVATRKVFNIEGGTLHTRIIEERCVSLEITKCHDNSYVLYETLDFDEDAVTTVGKAMGQFILWPTEFLRPT